MREKANDKQGLLDLVGSIGAKDLVIVEIGSFAGESAEIFTGSGLVKEVVCIDPWEFSDEGEGNSYHNIKDAERWFDARAAKAGGKIVKFKGTIDSFAQSEIFEERRGAIDLVYIDGLHTYEGCGHDIDMALSVLKPKLAVSGHDYACELPHVQGVKKAVNERLGPPDRTFCDSSWIKYLPVKAPDQ